MAYYPVMLDIEGKRCLVVGGGKVACRKIKSLLECGGKVTVIADKLCNEAGELSKENKIDVIHRSYISGDAAGYFLVVAACDDARMNELVANEAKERGILVNVADNLKLSSYIVPSVLRRQDLTIAVATGGKSPLLARKIREELEKTIGDRYEKLLDELSKARGEIKHQNLTIEEKIEIYENIIEKGEKI